MAVTDYLRGSGTSEDPYIIHNVAAWTQFFSVDKAKGWHFEVVADIDCAGATLTGVNFFYGSLNGNGYKVSNFQASNPFWFNSNSAIPGELKNIHIIATYTGSTYPLAMNSSTYRVNFSNVRFDLSMSGYTTSRIFYSWNSSSYSTVDNVIITYYGTNQLCMYDSTAAVASCYIIAPNTTNFNLTGVTRLSEDEALLPPNYPTLDENWVMDSISIPYLYENGRSDLTQKYVVKGTTKVGGVRQAREIACFTSSSMGLLEKLLSNSDGTYLIDLVDVYDPVIIIHYDDYGFPLTLNTAYAIGDVIHPDIPNGYRYICTAAGTSDNVMPTEPWSTVTSIITGSAIFTPVPVYAAETLLVQPHMYDFITGQAVG